MKIVTSGKRKTSIAKAIITEGDGKVFVNKKDIEKAKEILEEFKKSFSDEI